MRRQDPVGETTATLFSTIVVDEWKLKKGPVLVIVWTRFGGKSPDGRGVVWTGPNGVVRISFCPSPPPSAGRLGSLTGRGRGDVGPWEQVCLPVPFGVADPRVSLDPLPRTLHRPV